MSLGFADYSLYFLFGQSSRGCYGNMLLRPGRGILRRSMDYAVYIDVKGYLNSRHAARLGLNPFQLEVREEIIVRCDFRSP